MAIFASPLKISISGWAHFALMTPEQLLQAAVRFSDTGGWRDMLQKRERERELTRSASMCVSAAPPRSNQRTGLTMAHRVGTDQWGSWESRGMWGASRLFSLVDGDNGCAPRKLFLILSVVGSSPTSWVDRLETVLSLLWEQWSRPLVGRAPHPLQTGKKNTCPLNTLNQVTYKHVKEPHT